MYMPSLKSLCLGASLAALCGLALAAGDAGLKPPKASTQPIVDKSPRCEAAAVTECRTQCDRKKIEASSKDDLAKKQYECKQDCIRGC